MESAVSHILPLTLIRRRRVLPQPGKVLVSDGQKVNAADVIAETRQAGQHVIVDVRRAMGLPRIDQAEKLIQVSAGSRIGQGDIIAQISGLFGHTVKAPAAGTIIAVTAGRVMIETESTPLQVRSGLIGLVREVIAERGATVETSGALLQGWMGNDQVDQGMLLLTARSADDEFTTGRLDVSMRGAVLAGGHCSQANALRAAGDMALRGLILSSITADLLPLVKQAAYPILVLEGFGKRPYCTQAFQLLGTNEKRDVCINACAYDPASGSRPELIVPLPGIGELAPEAVEFKPGKSVRILTAPYATQLGSVVQVRPGKTRLKNGVHTEAADVRLSNNEIVLIPLANLDVLE